MESCHSLLPNTWGFFCCGALTELTYEKKEKRISLDKVGIDTQNLDIPQTLKKIQTIKINWKVLMKSKNQTQPQPIKLTQGWRNNQKITRRKKAYPVKQDHGQIPWTTQMSIFLQIINHPITAWTVKEVNQKALSLLCLVHSRLCGGEGPSSFKTCDSQACILLHYLILLLRRLEKQACSTLILSPRPFVLSPLVKCSPLSRAFYNELKKKKKKKRFRILDL